jgi:hypothetical protein
MVLPSLLAILYATRLIGLLLRASTSTAIYILLPSSLVSFRTEVDGRLSDLRWVQGLVATVAADDGETHCPKIHFEVSPLDGVVAMLVLLRPWTSTALNVEI